jgi:hypothetical protein
MRSDNLSCLEHLRFNILAVPYSKPGSQLRKWKYSDGRDKKTPSREALYYLNLYSEFQNKSH